MAIQALVAASAIRSALGLASANLDTQIGTLASASALSTPRRQAGRRRRDDDLTADFTVDNAAVNEEALTTEAGKTIAIAKGVIFELTATEAPGTYDVRVECAAADGTYPVTVRKLTVTGPGTP